MKKVIRLAIFGVFFLITEFIITQPLFATGKKAIFLPNNNSNAAQKYINSTKIENTQKPANTTNKIKSPTKEQISSSTAKTTINDYQISNQGDSTEQDKEEIDEGSLPLFTNKTSTDTVRFSSSPSSLSTTLSLFTSLIGIIILALIASWFIQKKTGFISNNFGKVLGIVPLDNKRFIYIVDVMGKMLVLGVTEYNITLLNEITDQDTINAYRLKYGQAVTPGLDKLFPFLSKVIKKDDNEESENKEEKTGKMLSDIEEKIQSDRKAAAINNSIEQKHKDRLERLNKMIINSNNKY